MPVSPVPAIMEGEVKELYIAAHEAAIERYLEDNPEASEMEAYEATGDAAYEGMRDMMADRIDAARDRMKEQGL